VALQPPGIGRVSLVDVGSKRVLGEYTMASGLLRSFNVPAADAGQTPDDVYYDGFNDACFLYDQAVALIALLQLGERKAARQLVDALLAVQNPDGGFPFACDQSVLGEHDTGFIRTGAVAWVCYSLLVADRPAFRGWFAQRTTEAARRCLAFLSGWFNPLGLVNGGKGRYVGHVLDPGYVVPWWSTEHNIDTWWCFDLATALYGDPAYRRVADGIRSGLEAHAWNRQAGIFWQGGAYANGRSVPDGQHALDVMSWGSVVLERWGRRGDMRTALEPCIACTMSPTHRAACRVSRPSCPPTAIPSGPSPARGTRAASAPPLRCATTIRCGPTASSPRSPPPRTSTAPIPTPCAATP
jgi:hypothetical protein